MNTSTRSHTAPSARRAPRAFTIVEIIVVVIIIGVLAAIIAPRLIGRVGESKRTAAAAKANTIAQQLSLYIADIGPPPAGSDLQFLVNKPSDVPDEKYKGYLSNAESLMDPWDMPFMLVMPGQKNKDFDIVSYGADKQPGGEGDNADIVKP
ncbi:type II secretion system major pseudopilin GspG [soil metagenome]